MRRQTAATTSPPPRGRPAGSLTEATPRGRSPRRPGLARAGRPAAPSAPQELFAPLQRKSSSSFPEATGNVAQEGTRSARLDVQPDAELPPRNWPLETDPDRSVVRENLTLPHADPTYSPALPSERQKRSRTVYGRGTMASERPRTSL